MIPLDNDYKDTDPVEQMGFSYPEPGPQIMICTHVDEKPTKDGDPMVTFSLDIAEGQFKGCFEKFPLKKFQPCTGKNTGYFKGVLKAFHDSNPNHPPFIQSNQFDPFRCVGLKIGANLRLEEYEKNREIKSSLKIGFLCGIQRVLDGEIKPMDTVKIKPQNNNFAGGAPMGNNNYSEADPPPNQDDDLPF